jgi:small subunit ribosomal protein S20
MPVTESAKKALRRDRRRTMVNRRIRRQLKEILKKTRKSPTKKGLTLAASALDRAAKKQVIHKQKAARLKSRLAKLAKKGKKKTL